MSASASVPSPALPATRLTWLRLLLARPTGQAAWALLCVATFVGLTWVRAESLAVMLPAAINLGLGLGTGLLGHSLTYWVARLGVPATHACPVAKLLKLAQIIGVPAGYLLLGGQMLTLPVLGATLALAGLGWAHLRGRGCGRAV